MTVEHDKSREPSKTSCKKSKGEAVSNHWLPKQESREPSKKPGQGKPFPKPNSNGGFVNGETVSQKKKQSLFSGPLRQVKTRRFQQFQVQIREAASKTRSKTTSQQGNDFPKKDKWLWVNTLYPW